MTNRRDINTNAFYLQGFLMLGKIRVKALKVLTIRKVYTIINKPIGPLKRVCFVLLLNLGRTQPFDFPQGEFDKIAPFLTKLFDLSCA